MKEFSKLLEKEIHTKILYRPTTTYLDSIRVEMKLRKHIQENLGKGMVL